MNAGLLLHRCARGPVLPVNVQVIGARGRTRRNGQGDGTDLTGEYRDRDRVRNNGDVVLVHEVHRCRHRRVYAAQVAEFDGDGRARREICLWHESGHPRRWHEEAVGIRDDVREGHGEVRGMIAGAERGRQRQGEGQCCRLSGGEGECLDMGVTQIGNGEGEQWREVEVAVAQGDGKSEGLAYFVAGLVKGEIGGDGNLARFGPGAFAVLVGGGEVEAVAAVLCGQAGQVVVNGHVVAGSQVVGLRGEGGGNAGRIRHHSIQHTGQRQVGMGIGNRDTQGIGGGGRERRGQRHAKHGRTLWQRQCAHRAADKQILLVHIRLHAVRAVGGGERDREAENLILGDARGQGKRRFRAVEQAVVRGGHAQAQLKVDGQIGQIGDAAGDGHVLAAGILCLIRGHGGAGDGRRFARLEPGLVLLRAVLIQVGEKTVVGAHGEDVYKLALAIWPHVHGAREVAEVAVSGAVACFPGVVGQAVAHL